MRMPNDTRLAEEVPELHLILGGHDHHYEEKRVRSTKDQGTHNMSEFFNHFSFYTSVCVKMF